MQVKDQPRALLRQIGADVVDLDKVDTCGFGGTFAVKFGNISGAMADDKAEDIAAKSLISSSPVISAA